MSVLIIAGTVSMEPEKVESAKDAAVEMMRETRKEPGNIEYAFSTDFADPGLIRIIEKWESQEALDAHFAAPHMAKFQKTLGAIGVKELKVAKYEIASEGPVF